MEIESTQNLIIKNLRFHKRLYGGNGPDSIDDEGIHFRIRQGDGGSNEIEVGADVMGHDHIASGFLPNTGEIIEVDGHKIKLNQRTDKDCYSQIDEDEIGFTFDGVVVE